MIQEISRQLYKLDIPLPNNPLKALNCYIFKGPERNLIIDTGFAREECRTALDEGLKELGIDLHKTDLFITHMHADHSGNISYLVTPDTRIYASKADAVIINAGRESSHWEEMRVYAGKSGFVPMELKGAIEKHPGYRFGTEGNHEITYMAEGDRLRVGDYNLEIVETSGHTEGHLCLYEPEKKILFSGDHILYDITPNIALWSDEENPLEEYFMSLDKIDKLEINLTLPGHRSLITSPRERIAELKSHHQKRLDEVLEILKAGTMNAYQVAARMTWDLTYKTWEEFPTPQKWFATGEAIAHIKYLVEKGQVIQAEKDGIIVYSLAR
ncbi:MBL fold metallo-hydrolase [Thermanaerosceptrum fracticalcis]|uniref:MBL fold metallo-hydrolase n=1 Tax=Thermanaerosceptrum fracticalcis TaxID=1712410 RepID=A0A7G6E301_THEFR|nr:MBL fold metallo-hydrolase [Thermanaerosceptrum fracticalcis]QNB46455.1 MBL fold metallo-hydrolase [Thermanaerosceptrum fracticalcis]